MPSPISSAPFAPGTRPAACLPCCPCDGSSAAASGPEQPRDTPPQASAVWLPMGAQDSSTSPMNPSGAPSCPLRSTKPTSMPAQEWSKHPTPRPRCPSTPEPSPHFLMVVLTKVNSNKRKRRRRQGRDEPRKGSQPRMGTGGGCADHRALAPILRHRGVGLWVTPG